MAPVSTPLHWEHWLDSRRFAALLGTLLFLCFPTVLLGWDSFFFRDYAFFGYPLAHYHKEAFWRGEIPLWNPYNDCGLPFLAQWNTLVLYPGSLIYLFLPLPWSLSLFCLVHFFLGGLGMYKLVRHSTNSPVSAALAGLSFCFSGLLLSCLKWPNNIAALGLAPWVVLAGTQAWQIGGRKWPLAALFGSLQMLTGAPEIILFTWMILTALCLVDLVQSNHRLAIACRFAGLGLVIALLCAAQLFPFLDLLVHSHRDRHFGGPQWPMPWWGWANFIVPLFRTFPSYHGVHAQPEQYWISTYYLALPALAFALYALVSMKDWRARTLAGLAIASCILALGDQGLVYKWLRQIFPFLSFMRFPIKLVVIAGFVLPLLAGIGLAHFLRHPIPKKLVLIFATVSALGILISLISWVKPHSLESSHVTIKNVAGRLLFLGAFLLAGKHLLSSVTSPSSKPLLLLLALLLWGDAITHAPWQNPRVPAEIYQDAVLDLAPRPTLAMGRAMISPPAYDKLDHLQYDHPVNDLLASRLSLYANANLLEHLPKVDGFFALYLENMSKILFALYSQTNPPPGLLTFLGVTHITAPGKTLVWTNRSPALPLITAGQQVRLASPDEILHHISSPRFNPAHEVFVEPGSSPPWAAVQDVELKSSVTPQEISVAVNSASATVLVLSQAAHPNWRATVNGVSTPLLKANYAFQALLVPQGKSLIVLRYQDNKFRLGLLISILTLACVLGSIFRLHSRKA